MNQPTNREVMILRVLKEWRQKSVQQEEVSLEDIDLGNLSKNISDALIDGEQKRLIEAIDRIKDLYLGDDGQAWDEARKYLEKIGESHFLLSANFHRPANLTREIVDKLKHGLIQFQQQTGVHTMGDQERDSTFGFPVSDFYRCVFDVLATQTPDSAPSAQVSGQRRVISEREGLSWQVEIRQEDNGGYDGYSDVYYVVGTGGRSFKSYSKEHAQWLQEQLLRSAPTAPSGYSSYQVKALLESFADFVHDRMPSMNDMTSWIDVALTIKGDPHE